MSEPAARVSDSHTCPRLEPRPNGDGTVTMIPHIGGPILPPGSPDVQIAGGPAATVGGFCRCNGPVNDVITTGSSTVRINGKAAARRGDRTAHGGVITQGALTVLIGG